jgi:hypothetical protein
MSRRLLALLLTMFTGCATEHASQRSVQVAAVLATGATVGLVQAGMACHNEDRGDDCSSEQTRAVVFGVLAVSAVGWLIAANKSE